MQDINYLLTTPPPSLNVMATPWRTMKLNTCKWVYDDCWWCMYNDKGRQCSQRLGTRVLLLPVCVEVSLQYKSLVSRTHTYTHNNNTQRTPQIPHTTNKHPHRTQSYTTTSDNAEAAVGQRCDDKVWVGCFQK